MLQNERKGKNGITWEKESKNNKNVGNIINERDWLKPKWRMHRLLQVKKIVGKNGVVV